jgi:serine protease Do
MLHRLAVFAMITCSIVGCAQNVARDPFPSATPQRVIDVTEMIFPAVVRLDVAQEVYRDGKRTLERGIGSGVIIDPQGRILTNYHVAGRGAEIFVTLFNKERVRASLVGDDHWTDLAVVQLDMEEISRRGIKFSFAELGTSTGVLTGQDVIAVGTPFGLARTMTLGIVSNNERTLYPDRVSIDEYETAEFDNWIQMDTPINPGNSGGPLVDLDGKVVGINTRGGAQNLNFAVPIDTAKEVIAQILASAKEGKRGHVTRADLGLELKPLQDLESFYAIELNQGVLVDSVAKNSPAAKAGVRTQDILQSINGQPINVRFPEELAPARKRISQLPIGQEATLTLRRGKETVTVRATAEKLEGAAGEEREFKVWGLSVREVTRQYASEQNLDDDKGVVVTSLNPGFPAARAELRGGDVIRNVNGTDIDDLEEFASIYDQLIKKKEPRVVVGVQSGRSRRTVVLRVTFDASTTEPAK